MMNIFSSKKVFSIGWAIIWVGIALLLGLMFAQSYILNRGQQGSNNALVTNFFECVDGGNPIMESYPRQCRHENTTFVEYIGNGIEKTDLIRVATPRPNQVVSSPLLIEGSAVGPWFFEGDFPIKLLDESGNLLATSIAVASKDWMVEDFVEFISEMEFSIPESKSGILIFEKDNPSDLEEYDDSLWIPILF